MMNINSTDKQQAEDINRLKHAYISFLKKQGVISSGNVDSSLQCLYIGLHNMYTSLKRVNLDFAPR